MWTLALFSAILGTLLIIQQIHTCNEAVCGSIVSKCLLTQSCKCDLKNCTCCKDCFSCLSYLYDECCSCVDMCPKSHEINESPLSKKSHVEDFMEPVPGLFDVLTQYPDPEMRWNSTTFPIDIDASHYGTKREIKIHMQSAEQEVAPIKSNIITLNCTVAFLKGCMNWVKCKTSCQTMGSSSYRWFHDGCCECIGQNCINYGINESRCRECSLNDLSDEVEEDVDEDELDYGYGETSGNELDDL
ncbi:hypothetical protein Zmor_004931 [Zophobas morio]|uniref:Protein twisted gastrulation n=1 Tax=Zophobas morio TaxID=2755281 RepID=A0AA38ISD4_9CUCU|nr:hypothetical protein Zmor_004931 [Zophobas morio]